MICKVFLTIACVCVRPAVVSITFVFVPDPWRGSTYRRILFILGWATKTPPPQKISLYNLVWLLGFRARNKNDIPECFFWGEVRIH